jgi:hypothetical protein
MGRAKGRSAPGGRASTLEEPSDHPPPGVAATHAPRRIAERAHGTPPLPLPDPGRECDSRPSTPPPLRARKPRGERSGGETRQGPPAHEQRHLGHEGGERSGGERRQGLLRQPPVRGRGRTASRREGQDSWRSAPGAVLPPGAQGAAEAAGPHVHGPTARSRPGGAPRAPRQSAEASLEARRRTWASLRSAPGRPARRPAATGVEVTAPRTSHAPPRARQLPGSLAAR